MWKDIEPTLASTIYYPSDGDLDANARAAILAASAPRGSRTSTAGSTTVAGAVIGD
jgi:hypothetical protein